VCRAYTDTARIYTSGDNAAYLSISISLSLTLSPLLVAVTHPSVLRVCVRSYSRSLSLSLSLCGSPLIYRAISFSNLSPETRTGHWYRPRGIAYIIIYVRVRRYNIYIYVCVCVCVCVYMCIVLQRMSHSTGRHSESREVTRFMLIKCTRAL
jgi:hypothetical protein